MSKARLEHVNISVSDAQRTATFLEKLTGWHRRWEGAAANGGYTIHLGDEIAYLAILHKFVGARRFCEGRAHEPHRHRS